MSGGCADYPDDCVTGAVRRSRKWRAATAASAPAHTPSTDDSWWVCSSNVNRRKRWYVFAKGNVGTLHRTISCACLDDRTARNGGRGYRGADAAKVVSINQIRFMILTERNNKMRWRCAWHIYQQWTRATKIGIRTI
jgi:hypothetical protein